MLALLEGTFLDLGPMVWALVIVGGLVAIDLFQLGPHNLQWRRRKSDGEADEHRQGESKNGGKKPKVGNSNVKKRHRKSHLGVLKIESVRNFILINAPCAFLFAFPQEEKSDIKLVPELNQRTVSTTVNSGSGAVEGAVYPEKVEPGNNYAVALGEEAEVAVLDRLEDLIKATENCGQLMLFSSTMPSVFALHKLVELKKKHSEDLKHNFEVSVLYEGFGVGEDASEDDIKQIEEKNQFLLRNKISLQRIALLI